MRANDKVRAVIFLVHGLGASSEQFHAEAIAFSRQGHRVLVPDLRGHGLSGVPAKIDPTGFTGPALAQDLLDILDQAGAGQVHWVGNSLGGILALYLLGTPAEKRLETLALFGTCFSLDLPAATSLALRLVFLPGAPVIAWLTARGTTRSPQGGAIIKKAMRQFNVVAGAAITANIRRYDFLESARAFNPPLLVLRGGRDRAVNLRLKGDMEKLLDSPNLRFVELKRGGHCANLDVPVQWRTSLLGHWTHQRSADGRNQAPDRRASSV
ncbi:alpha/beta hydrolase [Devosia sp. RR2S18]|nr:alpha/beta hydrolase [Devosia sp. RR2S18]WIJ27035.1 alpha/beta hydrolase [Devosia sp. RR2S18]